jgi:altronate dehydratase small subunit
LDAKRALIISGKDNVATALQDVEAGETVAARLGQEVTNVEAKQKVPFGFKIALSDIAKGQEVYKYGEVIGVASEPISRGDMVHIHNLEGTRGRGDLAAAGGKQ